MKILVVTPLYPPDIASHAPYVKELAVRLRDHENVSVLAYGHIPEAVDNVHIHIVLKRVYTPIRILHFTYKLLVLARLNDVLYLQNGPSVELPALLVSTLSNTPIILRNGDPQALLYSAGSRWYSWLHSVMAKRSVHTIHHSETDNSRLSKPEVLPFTDKPVQAYEAYTQAWNSHIKELNSIFKSVK